MTSSTTTVESGYIKYAIRSAARRQDEPSIVGNALMDLSRLLEGELRRFLLDVVSNYGQLLELEPADLEEPDAIKLRLKELLEANFGRTWNHLSKETFHQVTGHRLSEILKPETFKSVNMLFEFRNIWAHGLDFRIVEDNENGINYARSRPSKFIQYIHQEYESGSLYTPFSSANPNVRSVQQMRFFLTTKVLIHFYKEVVKFLKEIVSALSGETDEILLMALGGTAYNMTYDMEL